VRNNKYNIKSTQSQTLQNIAKHYMTSDRGKHTLHVISKVNSWFVLQVLDI